MKLEEDLFVFTIKRATANVHLGFTEEQAKEQFGFLMDAFQFGAPPHGGLAFGLDRLLLFLEDRKPYVILSPFQNNSGRDVMIDAPSAIDESQLKSYI
jgi:aspartyl-tRNA synthetase